MGIYTAAIEKMEAQLNVWGAQIKLLKARIESASSDIKLQRARELKELHAKHRIASGSKVKRDEKATNEAWEQTKVTADKIWDDLKTGIANTHSNIK